MLECHQQYIDIQTVMRGSERCGVIYKQRCLAQVYDAATDMQYLNGIPDWITLLPGDFAIFFPHDGHVPGISCNETPVAVTKIVVKIPCHISTTP
jgi:biofilm protein TabA